MGNGFVDLVRRQGLSLRALAEKLGVTHSLLSQVGNGKRALTPEMLDRIAAALGVERPTVLASFGRRDSAPASRRDIEALRARFLLDVAAQVGAMEKYAIFTASGGLISERRYVRCLPSPGRATGSIEIKSRVPGAAPVGERPTIEFDPGLAKVDCSSEVDEPWRITRFVFGATEGGVTFIVRERVEGAGGRGLPNPTIAQWSKWSCHATHLTVAADALVVDVTLPDPPAQWEPRYWINGGPMRETAAPLNESGPCASAELIVDGEHARLTVLRPLSCYSYALAWLSKDAPGGSS